MLQQFTFERFIACFAVTQIHTMCKSKQSAVIVSVTCPVRCVGSNRAKHSNGQTTSLFLSFFPLINLSSSSSFFFFRLIFFFLIQKPITGAKQMLSSPAFKVETCAKFVSQNVWVGAVEGMGSDTKTVPQI